MSNPNLSNQEEKQERNNVTDFKLIQGGKEPPSTEPNWLSTLEIGTVFLVQDKQPDRPSASFALGQFRLMEKTEKTCFVATMMEDRIQTVPVSPVRFCNKYSLWEVLAVIKTTEDIKTEEEDKEKGVAQQEVGHE